MLWWTLRRLRSSKPEVRHQAVEQIRRSADPRALRPLMAAIFDPSPKVRKHAAVSLKALGWQVSLGPADRAHLYLLLGDWDNVVSLGNACIDPVARILRDPLSPHKTAAVNALLRVGTAQAVKVIVTSSRHQERDVRDAAKEGVAHLVHGSDESRKLLEAEGIRIVSGAGRTFGVSCIACGNWAKLVTFESGFALEGRTVTCERCGTQFSVAYDAASVKATVQLQHSSRSVPNSWKTRELAPLPEGTWVDLVPSS